MIARWVWFVVIAVGERVAVRKGDSPVSLEGVFVREYLIETMIMDINIKPILCSY